jgi:hypothetical protein
MRVLGDAKPPKKESVMKKSLIWHFLLLLVAALFAYNGLVQKSESSAKDVVLVGIELEDIIEIKLDSDEKTLVVAAPALGSSEWIVELQRPAVAKAKKSPVTVHSDGGQVNSQDGGSLPVIAKQPDPLQFRFPASRNLVRSIEKLAPISAKRDLGQVDDSQLAAMKLDAPTERLLIKYKGGEHEWILGSKTYGNQGQYGRVANSDKVYLLPMGMLRGFSGDEKRLAERRLVDVSSEKITSFSLARDAAQRTFIHHFKEQAKKRYFAIEGADEEPSEDAKKFIAALRSLRVSRYVDADTLKKSTPAASFSVAQEEATTLKGSLFLMEGGDGYLQVGPWVGELKESSMREILDDLDGLLR